MVAIQSVFSGALCNGQLVHTFYFYGEEGRTKPQTGRLTNFMLFCIVGCVIAPEIQTPVCCPAGSVPTGWAFPHGT